MLIILIVHPQGISFVRAAKLLNSALYQQVANAADAPFSGAPQGGGVNPGNPGKNDYLMKLQTDK
ncbi:MAG: hypothetical protein P1P81_01775 [Desulfobulbales bacterium]|nr:hypothetical protein [Desulfobulbales bacterium]